MEELAELVRDAVRDILGWGHPVARVDGPVLDHRQGALCAIVKR